MKWLGLVILAAIAGAAILLGRAGPDTAELTDPPSQAGFVGSETCKKCHEERHETWLDTAHAYSLREADADSVRGRFDGETIESSHFFATPFMKDGKYYMRIKRKDDKLSGVFEVTRIVGRSFEQAYLMTGPKGEWRVLPLCWSLERQEWDRTHEVLADILGMTDEFAKDYDSREQVFNHGCGQCHATRYDVGHDPRTDSYDSTMLEGAVACESCHGPGSVHVRWHRGELDDRKYSRPARLIHPRDDLDATQVLETCGRCHYLHDWRYAIDDDPLISHHDIAVSKNMDRAGFLADGRLSGLNYHGSTQSQSACYLKGEMSCLDCHRMHGGKKFAMKWPENDDAQCAQCHQAVVDQGKKHTFHDDLRCVDCHMPKFMTGVLHFARDHTIRSPEPELTERYGAKNSPNACNVCHKDKTPKWAREWKEKWFDPAPRDLVEDVGIIVDLRRDPRSVSIERLIRTARRGPERHFFRMTALRELGHRDEPAARDTILSMLNAKHVELVQVAVELTSRRPRRAAAPALLRLLEHKTRTVRVDAAYALAQLGRRSRAPAMLRAYEDARRMLVRQRHFVVDLQRIVMIADAVDDAEAFEHHLNNLLRLVRGAPDKWPPAVLELLHRRGRRATEEGRHEDALKAYGQVRALSGKELPAILYVDSADSLEATGRGSESHAGWKFLVQQSKPGSPIHTLCLARLAGEVTPELEQTATELEKDPIAGEILRRVRWAIRVLKDG